MKEVKFIDRVPAYPGRVVMTPVEGKENTFDMVRADEPTEPGTALSSAAFNSLAYSRLTGRYYEPAVQRKVASSQSYTVNPIPTSGWTMDTDGKRGSSGSYTVEVNSLYASGYLPNKALDGDISTWYESDADSEILFTITFPAAIKVKKYKLAMRADNYTNSVRTDFQGSNDGTVWTTLFTTTEKPDDLTEYTLTTTGEYTRYRLKFTASSTGVRVYQFAISAYDVATYSNVYTITEGVPEKWDEGQRITILTPANANAFALTGNTLNGEIIMTLLQKSKRYMLHYSGGVFWAKEE